MNSWNVSASREFFACSSVIDCDPTALRLLYDYWSCSLQWRQLGEAERQVYEERAKKVNEENAIKLAEEQRQQEER